MLCIPALWGCAACFVHQTVPISTDLVSVMVFGRWLLLAELPWIPAFPVQGLWPKAEACPGIAPYFNRHNPQAHLLSMSLTHNYTYEDCIHKIGRAHV